MAADAPSEGERSAPDGGAAAEGDDAVLPFQLDRLDLRGRVARLDATLQQILSQHRYPPSVCALIGEAATLAALIGQAIKLRGRFTLQAQGDGPVSLIAADYFAPKEEGAPATMRAYARFDPERTPERPPEGTGEGEPLLGKGRFAMIIDQGPDMTPYQGVTPLVPGGLRESAEIYFAQSEQVATRFRLAVGASRTAGADGAAPEQWRAGGVMLQHLAEFGEGAAPEAEARADGLLSAEDLVEGGEREEAWRRATLLLDTAEEIELIGPLVAPDRLLWRLFHEESPRVYPPTSIAFGCTCSAEKVRQVLRAYPAEERAEMATDGEIVADCQFCGAQYRFDPDMVAEA